jgi:hypothetical protein
MLTIERKTAAPERPPTTDGRTVAGSTAAHGGIARTGGSTPGWERRIDLLLVRRLAA